MKTFVDHRCASRRQALALLGAASLFAAGATPAFASKLQQSAVGYQNSPKGDKKCGDCNLFESPKSCKSVDGDISPNGWCRLWVKKPA